MLTHSVTQHKSSTGSPPRQKFTLRARQHRLPLGKKTRIMGILNVTPDSFSGDGCLSKGSTIDGALHKAKNLIKDGADIIDIGGESTRPGSLPVSIKEEISRVIPIIKKLAKITKKPISVDTYKEPIVKQALDAGASIVNDIMGVNPNKKLLKMVKAYNATIVLMHIRGQPRAMQKDICYKNLIEEIISELQNSVENCLEIGIKSDRIIIDPGIGFGKTVEHNLEILRRLADFKILNCPLLIGTSRKSFIGKTLRKEVGHRLLGTTATVSISILNGAHIVRVHDVKEIKDIVRMTDSILNVKSS